MSQRITKLQRWLDLIAYLTVRRLPVPVEELMERIPAYARKWQVGDETSRATARRMFERDRDELRRAGVPLRTVAYSVHFGLDQVEGYATSSYCSTRTDRYSSRRCASVPGAGSTARSCSISAIASS